MSRCAGGVDAGGCGVDSGDFGALWFFHRYTRMITDGAAAPQLSVVSRCAGGVDAGGCGVDPGGFAALCFFHRYTRMITNGAASSQL